MNKSDFVLNVFTDGSFRRKYNYCGYGVHFPNNAIKSYGHVFKYKPLTNQRAELYAIYSALKKIKFYVQEHTEIKEIHIYSDSQYSINCLTVWYINWRNKNWKNIKGEDVCNRKLIEANLSIIDKLKEKDIKVLFNHVRSHTNKQDELSINNDIVDKLANKHFFLNNKN